MAKFSKAPRISVQGLVGSTSPCNTILRSASACATPAVNDALISVDAE
ncbi:hypothetical protein [Streptomyces sp. BH055]